MRQRVKEDALGCETQQDGTSRIIYNRKSNDESGMDMGKEKAILVERYDGRSDIYVGRSMYDVPGLHGEAFISNCSAEIGSIQKDRVTHAYEFDLSGEGM